MNSIPEIDFVLSLNEANVPLKRVHGVCKGPVDLNWWYDFSDCFQRWQIPEVRIHDSAHSIYDTVDLHHLFPDPEADPTRPENYRFPLTDDFIQAIHATGAETYFRLGESIEHQPTMMWNRPERWDPEKLAQVCLHIVRHYNDGWAGGFHLGIPCWEFWNEPDIPKCWTGTPEQFFQRYSAVARTLKKHFPNILIGTAGFAGDFVGNPSTPWSEGLRECVRQGVPIDFVSWHSYAPSWEEIPARARKVRQFLDSLGLDQAESHLGEWSYRPSLEGYSIFQAYKERRFDQVARLQTLHDGVAGAAFLFGTLIQLQDLPVDRAQYYTGDISRWGLFDKNGLPNIKGLAYDIFASFLSSDQKATRLRCENASNDAHILATRDASNERLKIGITTMNPARNRLAFRIDGDESASWQPERIQRVDEVTSWQELPLAKLASDGTSYEVPFNGAGICVVDFTRGSAKTAAPKKERPQAKPQPRQLPEGNW